MSNIGGPGRNGYAWRKARAAVRARAASGEPCARCGQPIDLDLDGNHRLAFTCGHKPGYSKRELGDDPALDDPANCQPEHRSCGSSDGARSQRPLQPTSRRW